MEETIYKPPSSCKAMVTQALYATQIQFSAQAPACGTSVVSWSMSPPVGTLGATGLYTSPAVIATQQTVTITATSTLDNSTAGTATLTLFPPPTVELNSPSTLAESFRSSVHKMHLPSALSLAFSKPAVFQHLVHLRTKDRVAVVDQKP